MRLAHWDESKVEWSTSESSAKSTNPNQPLWRCVGKSKRLRLPGEHWWTVAAILWLEASRTFLKHVMRTAGIRTMGKKSVDQVWPALWKAIMEVILDQQIHNLRHSWQRSSDELKAWLILFSWTFICLDFERASIRNLDSTQNISQFKAN